MTALEQIPVRTIDGNPATLADWAGRVRLVVNVASKCGLTPQYEALEALYRRYRDRGFEILALPANEFGAQEPGTEAEIKTFCSTRYDVTFPLFSKIVVKGSGRHPLYGLLTQLKPKATSAQGSSSRQNLVDHGVDAGIPDDISWNFEKFLIDRHGEVVERFSPEVKPDSELVVTAVERELARG